MSGWRIGVDASNLRRGGGITHLVELLRAAVPSSHGVSSVVVWGGRETLRRLEPRPWLETRSDPLLDRGGPHRIFWQTRRLSAVARGAGCDVLFVPGGSFVGNFGPVVTMSRNMLPFEWRELRRYGWSATTARLALLRWTQSRTFRRADGLIFLTAYAREVVLRATHREGGLTATIPHGVHEQFLGAPRPAEPIEAYSVARPFRVLYVSIVDVYKHQPEVVEAVARLRGMALPVTLELVGPAYPPSLRRLQEAIARHDPEQSFVRYVGAVPYEALRAHYDRADLCVFASSCENMPNILLEGMASGLPIACSNRGPMPEVLGDAGFYFDPDDVDEMTKAIRDLIRDAPSRDHLARASSARARGYSWERCARETLQFLGSVAAASRPLVAAQGDG